MKLIDIVARNRILRFIYKGVVATAFFAVLFEVRPWYFTALALIALCYAVALFEGWRPSDKA